MRGSNTLFADIFDNVAPVAKARKGRSASLIEKRNDLLLHRYVFYAQQQPRLSYDFIINTLSEELYIAPITIVEIIADNRPSIQSIRKQEPTRAYFAKKFPCWVWDARVLLVFA